MNFITSLQEKKIGLNRSRIQTLQVNLGKLCNQVCSHCHVDAGPDKTTENMNRKTIDRILLLLSESPEITTVDLTGGAPELNPNFSYFITELSALKKQVIDRCNLTILLLKSQERTLDLLKKHRVKVVASLPCYSEENVDEQRGSGIFQRSIKGLQKLNAAGYGQADSELEIDLVYNPNGDFLPGNQQELELAYKVKLQEDFGIVFNRLLTITNMPIKRYSDYLKLKGSYQQYMQLLLDNFNADAAQNIMCRSLISVGWDGKLYDCDFNQMLELPVQDQQKNLWDVNSFSEFSEGKIVFANHCYGCTAGAGSSCGGALL